MKPKVGFTVCSTNWDILIFLNQAMNIIKLASKWMSSCNICENMKSILCMCTFIPMWNIWLKKKSFERIIYSTLSKTLDQFEEWEFIIVFYIF